jgi:glutamine amidotransferase
VLVGILDLGINNLTSVQKGFSAALRLNDKIVVIDQGESEERPDLLILPGLGKFAAGMMALHERNLVEKIRNWSMQETKVVGICLGMQLLGVHSDESPGVEGLSLIDSVVRRLPIEVGERIPHIGWAEVIKSSHDEHFPSLKSQGDFYFVHSFHLLPINETEILTTTPFGKDFFVSSVLSGNILGVQFHPEKSGMNGIKLIKNFLDK